MNSNSSLPTKLPPLDENGHLTDWQCWTPAIAEILAHKDSIALEEDHWQLIKLLREIYHETGETPPMRLFIRVIKQKLGEDKANSRYLYRLFPEAPIRQLSRYAGLPKPPHCL